jgi:hypothetical protein
MTDESRPTLVQVLEDVIDLSAGAVTVFLPLFILAIPCAVLVILPVIAAAAILGLAAAVLALPLLPPYLLVRRLRHRTVN